MLTFGSIIISILLSVVHGSDNNKKCSICSFSSNGVIETAYDEDIYAYAKKMGPSWYGHAYCCNGIPEDTVDEVEVINSLGVKRILRRDNNKIMKRNESLNLIKFNKNSNKTQIYYDFVNQPLQCHPLIGNFPTTSPYSELLTGRKKANFVEGFLYLGPATDRSFTCTSNDRDCDYTFSVSITVSNSASYSISNSLTNSLSVTNGETTSNSIDDSIAKSISDNIEISHQRAVTNEMNGNTSEDFSRCITRTTEESTSKSHTVTDNEDRTHSTSRESSISETWSENNSVTETNGKDKSHSETLNSSNNDCSTHSIGGSDSSGSSSTSGWDAGVDVSASFTEECKPFGVGGSATQSISGHFNYNSSDETNESHTKDFNDSTESCHTESKDVGDTTTTSWSKSETIDHGHSKSDTITNGVSDSLTRGHSESDTVDHTRSDSTSDAVTNSYSQSRGWSKSESDTVGNSYSHNYGYTNTYSKSESYSKEKSKSEENAKQFTSSQSFDYSYSKSEDQTFKATAKPGQTITIYGNQRVYNVILPYICGLDDKSGIMNTNFTYYAATYYERIGNSELPEANFAPVYDHNIKPFVPIDGESYTGTIWNDENTSGISDVMMTGQYLYSDNSISFGNGYQLTLNGKGNLMINIGSTVIWETETGYLDEDNSQARFFVTATGHLRIEATNFLTGNARKDEWITIWDTLPINLQYNVGFSSMTDKYTLKFVLPKDTISSYITYILIFKNIY